MRVFLADLGHNQLTISSDVYPLGIANLATYVQAYLDTGEPVDVSLFREPQHLKAALDSAPPDVLGLSNYAWNHKLQAMLDDAPETMRNLVNDFLRESQEELFPSREACLAWARANFAGLVDGSVGGNLLSKYSLLGRFGLTTEVLQFLASGIRCAMGDSTSADTYLLLETTIAYLRCVVLSSPFSPALDASPAWSTSFDIESWRSEGYSKRLEAYRFPEPRHFSGRVPPDRRTLIESRVATFGEHPSQLGKFTRTMFARDLRRDLIRLAAGSERAEGAL